MAVNTFNFYNELHNDVQTATKMLVETFLTKLYPIIKKIGDNIKTGRKVDDFREKNINVDNVFSLCLSQINKCYLTMIDIFKIEHQKQILLLESWQCMLERLSWCFNRLESIEKMLKTIHNEDLHESSQDDAIFATPMYFVNWIDQTFDILSKLSELISDVSKNDKELHDQWENEMTECLKSLHTLTDELLLSAMTLCRYCLPTDQHVIKARCQVVLRETKALLNDIIQGDIETSCDNSVISLKLPIKPTNVNVLIDVLKDVLYALETNTNTALLSLLVHCYSYSISPVDVLKDHFVGNVKGMCDCLGKSEDEITETCNFIKEFDLHNERLLQIGSFAVSCSSDEKRILTLRSNLATLEALDPHLVPAIIMAPESHHSTILRNSWNKEVLEIRDSIFLIVDPAAFAEKAKQMMHQKLLDILRENLYDNNKICSFINIGSVVYDFFRVYNKYEPDAINEHEKLQPLLTDLNKALSECKVVSDLLCTGNDFIYNVKKIRTTKNVSIEQVHKRLKLLYTVVNRINAVLHPKDNEDELFANEDDAAQAICDVTHSIHVKNNATYLNSPRKAPNALTKSVFARTNVIRTPASKLPLFMLTKNLKHRKCENLNFSQQLEELCNATDVNIGGTGDSLTFFYSPMKKRPSLRKAILNRHKLTIEKENETINESSKIFEENNSGDDSLDFQITEVLNQINDLTTTFSSTVPYKTDAASQVTYNKYVKRNESIDGVLCLNINETVTKHVWNIPINTSGAISNDSHATSNISQPSNVTTFERLNDLDLVESRLSDLRVIQLETSL